MKKLENPKKILIVKISALGDLYFARPALTQLKRLFPDSKIDWLVDQKLSQALDSETRIYRRVEIESQVLYHGSWLQKMASVYKIRKQLKDRYDFIFLLHRSKSYLPLLFGKGPIFALSRSAQDSTWPLKTWSFGPLPEGSKRIHESVQIIRLIQLANAPFGTPVQSTAELLELTRTCLPKTSAQSRNAPLGIHIGGGQNQGHEFQLKTWPHWEKLIENLLRDTTWTLRLFGGASDRPLADRILAGRTRSELLRIEDQVGHLSLNQLPDQIAQCQAFVGVDSGPLHIADYFGIPSVGIFGPTSPSSWGLLREYSCALSESFECQPCYQDDGHFPLCPHSQRCMIQLDALRVQKTLQNLHRQVIV